MSSVRNLQLLFDQRRCDRGAGAIPPKVQPVRRFPSKNAKFGAGNSPFWRKLRAKG